jgi:hypothetical protein
MPTALLPDGQIAYVNRSLEVSVSFPDRNTTASMEQKLREALATDNRQLFVRVQGGGGYGPWCFWIQWGSGGNSVRTEPVCLADNEHTPEAVLAHVQAELSRLKGKRPEIH